MKRYTPHLVKKWILKDESISHARLPKPFPGKAPTRLILSAAYGNKRFVYIGKPSRVVYQTWVKFIEDKPYNPFKNEPLHTMYGEFDKAGLIHLSMSAKEGYPPFRKKNGKLWAFYHPELLQEDRPNWLKYITHVVNHAYKIS